MLQSDFVMRSVIGLILAFGVGAGCRWFDVPVPSPPKILGALLVVATTLGYLGVDKLLSKAPQQTTVQSETVTRTAVRR